MEDDLCDEWLSIKDNLKEIPNTEIPRTISLMKVEKETKYSLVCFCDASKTAYAATVYLLQENNNETRSDLIFSKTRFAPVKGMTIPKLELMGVLIGVRSIQFVKNELHLTIEQVRVATDSQCVLQRIVTEKRLPVFVKNRVNEIKSHKDIALFYVHTKENPSDIATRGCDIKKLSNNTLWWHGPEWLIKQSEECTMKKYNVNDNCEETSMKNEYSNEKDDSLESVLNCVSKEVNEKDKSNDTSKESDLTSPFELEIDR